MSGCGVCISGGDFGSCNGYRNVIVRAGKNWTCAECGCLIPKKSLYELASGFNDGSHWQTKTCLICADIAEALSCNGRWHGTLWDGIDAIIDKLNIACLYKMSTPEAKAKIQGMWIDWLDQEIERKRARKEGRVPDYSGLIRVSPTHWRNQ